MIEREVDAESAAAIFEVHPDNAQIVAAFLTLQTQWRVIGGGMGFVYQGIDYTAVPAVLALLDVPRRERAEVFIGLRVMEASAIPFLNARSKGDDE